MAHVAWPRAQPLGQSVSLKFSLETRLESEFSEPSVVKPPILADVHGKYVGIALLKLNSTHYQLK